MPEGIEVFNDNGRLVLSSNLRNPVLRATGSVNTIANTLTGAFNTSMLKVPYTKVAGSFPMCAIRPPSAMMYIGINRYPATAGVDDIEFIYVGNMAVGTAIPYWVFDTPPAVGAGLRGLEIYDSTGALNFSIQNKPLKIANVIGGNFTGIGTTNYTFITGHTYAAILGKWTTYQTYRALGNRTDGFGRSIAGITNGIATSRLKFEETSGNNAETINQSQQIVIADVTGY